MKLWRRRRDAPTGPDTLRPLERRTKHVIDNRVFLLGLDSLYRDAVKPHERNELLNCARRVAGVLRVEPEDVPIEGYYSEGPELTEYFKLMRALQGVSKARTSEVTGLPEFQRLLAVMSAPLYGRPKEQDTLLNTAENALTRALSDCRPEWNVERLTTVARTKAEEVDDFSLVGLAARIGDAVVLAALGESVVLYTFYEVLGVQAPADYLWAVDDDLAAQARRFIDAFEQIFGDKLPPPEAAQAEQYWRAYEDNNIVGRCVRLGHDQSEPVRHYHWAVRLGNNGLSVHEFWDTEVWTTDLYRESWLAPSLPSDKQLLS